MASISTNGLTTGLTNGATTITATSGSVSGNATLTVVSPPAITQQPQNLSVWTGSPATFGVTAGGGGPFSYQWALNGTNLSGATNANYTINAVAITNGGVYIVGVTNAYGGVLSTGATLTVDYITQQPTNLVVTNGGTAVFSVGVAGVGPFSYQWQLDGSNLPPIITTVAGNGTGGYAGDGGAATNARLNNPYGVAVDSLGNIVLADTSNNRIRKVGTNGNIALVAGNGSGGYSGDGGVATSAALYTPRGVAVDSGGNIYIADFNNSRIRQLGTNGIITTVAGNGGQGYSGDGVAATGTELNNPSGVTVDSLGNLFIADTANQRIRKVGVNGIIATVAGNGSASYSGDGGMATNAALSNPSGVAVDSLGNIYFADTFNSRIRKVGTNGIITTEAGNGSQGYSGDGGAATNAALNNPFGVAVDNLGDVFIADSAGQRIRKVGTNGIITTVAGNGSASYSGDGGVATNAALNNPAGVAVDSLGEVFIADASNNRSRKVSSNVPTLVLRNISTNNLGNYSVVIASPAGTITSTVASLSLPLAPQNFAAFINASGLQLQLAGSSGYFYILQSSTNLTPPVNWQPVITNPADGNGNWSFTVTNLTGAPASFFRAFRQ